MSNPVGVPQNDLDQTRTLEQQVEDHWRQEGADWASDFIKQWPQDEIEPMADWAAENLSPDAAYAMMFHDPIDFLPDDVADVFWDHEKSDPEEAPTETWERKIFVDSFHEAVLAHWHADENAE